MVIGHDTNCFEIKEGMTCSFTLNGEYYIGVVTYEESEYAYCFEMEDDRFPSLYMHRADPGSIRIIQ